MRFIVASNILRCLFVACALGTITFAPSAAIATSAQRPRVAFVHYAVSTSRPQAQREFDAAMLLLYAFNPEEATFHFQAAARIDPDLAMAYWGIALAAGPNVNTAYDLQRAEIGRAAIAQARQLDAHASAEERALIEALAKRYVATNAAAVSGAENAYAEALGAVSRAYPNDVDVKTMYAESLMDLTPLDMWHADGTPNRYTQQVIALLDDVLARDPDALGANHYLIHTYEYSRTPQAALASARRLAGLTFAAGAEHLAHMPAHIFMRTGDFDAAISASLIATGMFATYLGQEHSDVHNGYFHHDLQVLDYAYMMSGQWSKARATATQIADQVNDNGAAVETYVRFHRWHELLALTPPAQPGLRWRFAQAMAAAGTGDVPAARATLGAIDGLHDSDARTGIARALLAASIASREHHADVADSELRRAVALQDGIPIKEPPAWFYPVRETLGAQLDRERNYVAAQRVFEDDLARNPQNPRSLFGLSDVLKKMGSARAATVTNAFRHAWHHADRTLTLDDL